MLYFVYYKLQRTNVFFYYDGISCLKQPVICAGWSREWPKAACTTTGCVFGQPGCRPDIPNNKIKIGLFFLDFLGIPYISYMFECA